MKRVVGRGVRTVPGNREESALPNAQTFTLFKPFTRCSAVVPAKMVLPPSPPTFTTFTIFAKFAKFAKFATFDPAREHPARIRRHRPRLRSISARTVSALHPPLPAHTRRVGLSVT